MLFPILLQAKTHHDRTVCMFPLTVVIFRGDDIITSACPDYKYLYFAALHNMDVGLLSVQTDLSHGAAAMRNTCNCIAICSYILVKDWQDQLLESFQF